MVKMGLVWDRTVEVLNGRTGMIARIAVLGILLPSVVRDGYVAFSAPGTPRFALIGGLLAIASLVILLWAQLAIVAIATDPANDAAASRRQASGRVLPAVGITALLTIIVVLLAMPPVVALILSGFDFAAAAANGSSARMTPPSANTVLFIGAYSLLFLIGLIWIGARLVLLNPIILNERLGIGALRRSIRLTKGLTWRIIGVMILFVIVTLVAGGAARSVTGIVFRLALGAEGIPTATFLASIAGEIVTTALTALAAVFTAQLYVAVREKHVTQ